MSLTAAQLCQRIKNRAKAPLYDQAASDYLNLALAHFAQKYDFDTNRAAFNFNFNPAAVPIGNLQAQLASGPFKLPADYLRAKRDDVQFYPVAGYPFQLTPIDLNEFDHQWQQAGFQNYPVFWVTDTSLRADVLSTTGQTTVGSGVITNMGSTAGLGPGIGVYGDAIRLGSVAQIVSVGTATVTVAPAADVITANPAANLTFATNPIAYVWPPAGGAYPCFVRYFRKRPDIVNASSSQTIPWFEWQDILLDQATGLMFHETDDNRAIPFLGEGQPNSVPTQMRRLLQMADDKANRARHVHFDRRRFGPGWSNLPKSKSTFGF